VRRIITVALLVAFAAGAAAWRLADVKPDPNAQAIADGCQRDTTKIYTGFAPNWVYVNDKDFPSSGPPPAPRWVSGTVKGPLGLLASRVASSDDPITHHSYDANIDVTVDNANDFLTGVSRDATPEQGTIHLERESAYLPFWAWPQPGDNIQALGSWVWDCDHYQGRGEKTEFHPFRALWVQRHSPGQGGNVEGDLYVSSDATPAGQQAECAHETKGTDAFKACSHAAPNWLSVNGAYSLSLCLPTQVIGARIAPKVIDEGSVNAPAVVPKAGPNGCWSIGFTIAAPTGTRVVVAKRIVLVSTHTPPFQHLRLRFDKLLTRRAMDPSCPPDKPDCPYANESTLLGQITTAPGEWQLYWSVNGSWGRWPGTLAAHDAVDVPRQPDGRLLRRPRQAVDARHPRARVRLRSASRLGRTGQADAAVPGVERGGQLGRRRLSGRDHSHEQRARARHTRRERVNGRLDLPTVERQRVLPADIHG